MSKRIRALLKTFVFVIVYFFYPTITISAEMKGFDVSIGTTWEKKQDPYQFKGFTQFNISYREENNNLVFCSVKKIELRGDVSKDGKVKEYDLLAGESHTFSREDKSLVCIYYDDKVQITDTGVGKVCNYSMTLSSNYRAKNFEGTCIENDVSTGKQSVVQYETLKTEYDIKKYIDLDAPIAFPTVKEK